MLNLDTDTITALATPAGRGGVAIVRVSGKQVHSIIATLLKQTLTPRKASYLPFYNADGSVLDEGIALFFPAPHSFTGEDVLELHGHGGPIIVDLLIERVVKLGARLARPGEFSERAFLNGKLDLAQAEAVADLINAASKTAARAAVRSLQGEFSKLITSLVKEIIALRVFIEAQIDFSDEEIDFLSTKQAIQQLTSLMQRIDTIKAQASQGSLLREGFTAIIVGEPNVGKSSLLNCLSGKEIAIVTDIPGTTRDLLRDVINIEGIPMHLIDTAGLRDSEDRVEQEGIRRAYQEMQAADIILYVLDANRPELKTFFTQNTINAPERYTLLSSLAKQHINSELVDLKRIIFILNKIDLLAELPARFEVADLAVISSSAKNDTGIALLNQVIKEKLGVSNSQEGVFLARRRHLSALTCAYQHLQAALDLLQPTCLELVAEELRLSQLALWEITGEYSSDDLLGAIFSSFCIGK